MSFRSPPPHRHSSGHRGGRSDFEKAQLDLQRTVKRLGFTKLPLNDEKWRPLLAMIWGFSEAQGQKVWSFDRHDGRIHSGFIGNDAIALKRFADGLQAALLKAFPREYVLEAKPVFQIGKTSVCYFENVWTPLDALDGRKH